MLRTAFRATHARNFFSPPLFFPLRSSRLSPAGKTDRSAAEGLLSMDDAHRFPCSCRPAFPPSPVPPMLPRSAGEGTKASGRLPRSLPGTCPAELRTMPRSFLLPQRMSAEKGAAHGLFLRPAPSLFRNVPNLCNLWETLINQCMFTSLPGKSLRKAPSVQCAASAAEHTLPKGAEITMYPVKNIDQFKVTNKNAHIVFTKPTETNKKRPFPPAHRLSAVRHVFSVPVFVPIKRNKNNMLS